MEWSHEAHSYSAQRMRPSHLEQKGKLESGSYFGTVPIDVQILNFHFSKLERLCISLDKIDLGNYLTEKL